MCDNVSRSCCGDLTDCWRGVVGQVACKATTSSIDTWTSHGLTMLALAGFPARTLRRMTREAEQSAKEAGCYCCVGLLG
jgi:hypothetical protein